MTSETLALIAQELLTTAHQRPGASTAPAAARGPRLALTDVSGNHPAPTEAPEAPESPESVKPPPEPPAGGRPSLKRVK